MKKITLLVLVLMILNIPLKLSESKAIADENLHELFQKMKQKGVKGVKVVIITSDIEMFEYRLEKMIVQWVGQIKNKLKEYIERIYVYSFGKSKGDIEGTPITYDERREF